MSFVGYADAVTLCVLSSFFFVRGSRPQISTASEPGLGLMVVVLVALVVAAVVMTLACCERVADFFSRGCYDCCSLLIPLLCL